MNKYIFQCQTTTSGHSWSYETYRANDQIAMKHAQECAVDFQHCQWFMALDVWAMPDERLIGTVTIKPGVETIVTLGAEKNGR